MQKTFTPDDVTIRDVPTTPVAIMEHRGDPATLGANTIQRFIAWRMAARLHPRTSPTFNGLAFRAAACVACRITKAWTFAYGTHEPIEGRMASRSKPARSLADAARCCASSATSTIWSPPRSTLSRLASLADGEEARDFPIYCQRLSFFPEVPEHEAVAELFSSALNSAL